MTLVEKMNAVVSKPENARMLLSCVLDRYGGASETLEMLFPFLSDKDQEELLDAAIVRMCGKKRYSRSDVLEYDGERRTVKEWADELGMLECTLIKRLDRGWSIEQALTEPVRVTGLSGQGRVVVTVSGL